MSGPPGSPQALIDDLIRTAGATDAIEGVRIRARELIELHANTFGNPTMPLNLDVLASLRGIVRTDELPLHSDDAELVPDRSGAVTMRVNPDRPETRQRFSIAHEISHTFLPGYITKAWCRTDARYRDRNNPDDYIEMLCDIGAAELIFPAPWFSRDAEQANDAPGLIELAKTYRASREATIRRFAETSSKPLSAVFFTWKIKPTQRATVGSRDQPNLFGISAEDQMRDALRLRSEYAIPSPSFKAAGYFLPKDKSVPMEGPIYRAASTCKPTDEECYLDLGQASGVFRASAVPLWTPDDERGPAGEHAVAAVLHPISVRRSGARKISADQTAFF